MRKVLLAVGVSLAIGSQWIHFERDNPPVSSDVPAPPPVKTVLRDGCYDCHSNETAWPAYTWVAPASWLAHYDVTEGRKRLNFSNWETYASDPGTEAQKLKNLAAAITADDMPPWYYRLFHPKSRLSKAQRDTVSRWIAGQIASLPAQ